MLNRLASQPIRVWQFLLNATKELCMRILLTSILFLGYLFFSMMVYAIMRQLLVPQKTHALPVHLYFNPQCTDGSYLFESRSDQRSFSPINVMSEQTKKCPYPSAEFYLSGGERLLSPGHTYTIAVELDMPESPQNADIGMFMVNLTMYSNTGRNIGTSIRPAILHFKSSLLHTLSTLFYSFPLVLGLTEEKQRITVTMFENYQESYFTDGSVYATVIIMSHKIQLYSASLSFDANFTGLAYYLYHWPISMTIIIVSGLFFSISMVTVLMWVRRVMDRMNHMRLQRRHYNQRMTLRAPAGLDPIPEEEEEQRRVQQHIEDLSTSDGSTVANDTADNMSTTSSATEIATSDISELDQREPGNDGRDDDVPDATLRHRAVN